MFDHSDFFLKPLSTLQRQYEALRAFYVDKLSVREVSSNFGFTQSYFNKLCCLFHRRLTKGQIPVFFAQNRPGPRENPQKPKIKERIVELRRKNYSILNIKAILNSQGIYIGLSQIYRLLKAEGFSRLPRRTKGERKKIGNQRNLSLQRLSGDVNLDCTAIPHWGNQSVLEKNWLGKRRVALKSILALVAQDPDTGILPYSNAEIRQHTKSDEVFHFVDFWRETSQESLKCLIFDSKLMNIKLPLPIEDQLNNYE